MSIREKTNGCIFYIVEMNIMDVNVVKIGIRMSMDVRGEMHGYLWWITVWMSMVKTEMMMFMVKQIS